MLISLVENAVKHGVDPCCDAGHVVIARRSEAAGSAVTLPTTARAPACPRRGVGLANIRERLKAPVCTATRLTTEGSRAPRRVAWIKVTFRDA